MTAIHEQLPPIRDARRADRTRLAHRVGRRHR